EKADLNINESSLGIVVSFNGGAFKTIRQALTSDAEFKSIPFHPELTGIRFKVYPGSYYAVGPNPFIVYTFSDRLLSDGPDEDNDDWFFSYANPAGAL